MEKDTRPAPGGAAENPESAEPKSTEPESANPESAGPKSSDPKTFDDVERDEWEEIRYRRRVKAAAKLFAAPPGEAGKVGAPRAADDGRGAPADLFGVALSGGGIRSASFCLGALQALDRYGVLPRIDYLSTVSGGGYIGGSVVASYARGQGFPYRSDETDGRSDVKDSAAVGHLRDHGNFLAPDGITDVFESIGIVLRGLAVNLVLVLTLVLPAATVTILANPTFAHLDHSVFWDLLGCKGVSADSGWAGVCAAAGRRWIGTLLLGAALLVLLIGWGLRRSFRERFEQGKAARLDEPASGHTAWAARLLLATLIALVIESQDVVVHFVAALFEPAPAGGRAPVLTGTTAVTGTAALGIFTAVAAFFRKHLAQWVAGASKDPKIGPILRAAASRLVLYALAAAVPLLVYILYLALVVWGVQRNGAFSFAPDAWAALFAPWGRWTLFAVLALYAGFWADVYRRESGFAGEARKFVVGAARRFRDALRARDPRAWIVFVLAVLLPVVAVVVRKNAEMCSPDPLLTYVAASLIVIAISIGFTENANALHRLYRDRLNVAFRLGTGPEGTDSLSLAKLARLNAEQVEAAESNPGPNGVTTAAARDAGRSESPGSERKGTNAEDLRAHGPYLLVNAALNVRRSRALREKAARRRREAAVAAATRDRVAATEAATAATAAATKAAAAAAAAAAEVRCDPARRGRNAEFFLMSGLHVGSDATGYVPTADMLKRDAKLDLATAVAISGAAVSSNMGRIGLGILAPTLALLNLRLGYWMDNPRQVVGGSPGENLDRLYLLKESFGLLSADSRRIYVTDGGHIDNIGLYQLLKRRCPAILVIDAEADAGYDFGALIDVQRFARIDLGIRIDIPWRSIRRAAVERAKDREAPRPDDAPEHDAHFVFGKIKYVENDASRDGILLYVKASVTGDEPDYVLDYERRYPAFPHESTGDQFFSEEQMEAYRALGFHCMRRALDIPKPHAAPAAAAAQAAREVPGAPVQAGAPVVETARSKFRTAIGIPDTLNIDEKAAPKAAGRGE